MYFIKINVCKSDFLNILLNNVCSTYCKNIFTFINPSKFNAVNMDKRGFFASGYFYIYIFALKKLKELSEKKFCIYVNIGAYIINNKHIIYKYYPKVFIFLVYFVLLGRVNNLQNMQNYPIN